MHHPPSSPAAEEEQPRLGALRPAMPALQATAGDLARLKGRWETLALLTHLSTLTLDTSRASDAFATLADSLLTQLAVATLDRATQNLARKARAALDILTRNLFERTADIGFLATDDEIVAFCAMPADTRPDGLDALRARFRQYVAKYSVYSDVVLFDAAGCVIARMAESAVTSSREPLLARALAGAPYVESFGALDFVPGEPSLTYACRVVSGTRAVGVLVLVFDIHAEAEAIFGPMATDDDVLVFADADRRVLLTSDAHVVPPGIRLPAALDGHQIKLAGRRLLAAPAAPTSYQGYGGPGWSALCVVPVSEAFQAEPSSTGVRLAGDTLFSPEMLAIPRQAEQIQQRLHRLVWNGRVQQSSSSDRFSRALLLEIAAVGAATRRVFDSAVENLQSVAVASVRDEAAARAAMAVELLDRNLYERACDCRWWALSPTLKRMVPAECRAVLEGINALYTVYTRIVLFDRGGRVIACSADPSLVGESIDPRFSAAVIAASADNAYAVSPFAPSTLYTGAPTYLYGAAIRQAGSVVGGIALVFDSGPEFSAMLDATLPDFPGSASAFLRPDGSVLAERGTLPVEVPADMLSLAPGERRAVLAGVDGRYVAIGASAGAGYREFKTRDGYREPVIAVVMIPCGPEARHEPDTALAAHDSERPTSLEIASFRAGETWWAVPTEQVRECVELDQLARVRPSTGGDTAGAMALHDGVALTVLDLGVSAAARAGALAVVLGRGHAQIALLCDALGPVVRADIVEMTVSAPLASPLQTSHRVAKVGGELLPLLDVRHDG